MAGDITVTPADVRPLKGAVIRRAVAGEALTFGNVVYISSYSGTLPVVSKASGTAVARVNAFGVVVAPSVAIAGSSVASGEQCDVVVFGPVTGMSGMTSGNTVWVADTTGIMEDAKASTKSAVVGVVESPTVLFVRPGLFTISS